VSERIRRIRGQGFNPSPVLASALGRSDRQEAAVVMASVVSHVAMRDSLIPRASH